MWPTRQRERYYRLRMEGRCTRSGCGEASRPGRVFCEKHALEHGKKRTENQAKHKAAGLCRCGRQRVDGRSRCEACLLGRKKTPLERSLKSRARAERERDRVLEAYGRACACCGETTEVFLCVDHVRNNGAEERRRSSATNARMAIRSGFSADYQLLCANCNHAKAVLGRCPHQAA